MRKLTIIGIVIIAAATVLSSWAVYDHQRERTSAARHSHGLLARQAKDAQKQYDTAVASAEIDTSSWKKYCDPLSSLCLKYPEQWTLEGGEIGEFGYVRTSLSSPDKGVSISYDNPLVKDGGAMSNHIVKLHDLKVGGEDLKIIGSYAVSSGTYTPNYLVVTADQAVNLKEGQIGLIGEPARFTIGKYDGVRLASQPMTKKFTSSAQAEAWFKSVEGKTVLKIFESYGIQ